MLLQNNFWFAHNFIFWQDVIPLFWKYGAFTFVEFNDYKIQIWKKSNVTKKKSPTLLIKLGFLIWLKFVFVLKNRVKNLTYVARWKDSPRSMGRIDKEFAFSSFYNSDWGVHCNTLPYMSCLVQSTVINQSIMLGKTLNKYVNVLLSTHP